MSGGLHRRVRVLLLATGPGQLRTTRGRLLLDRGWSSWRDVAQEDAFDVLPYVLKVSHIRLTRSVSGGMARQ